MNKTVTVNCILVGSYNDLARLETEDGEVITAELSKRINNSYHRDRIRDKGLVRTRVEVDLLEDPERPGQPLRRGSMEYAELARYNFTDERTTARRVADLPEKKRDLDRLRPLILFRTYRARPGGFSTTALSLMDGEEIVEWYDTSVTVIEYLTTSTNHGDRLHLPYDSLQELLDPPPGMDRRAWDRHHRDQQNLVELGMAARAASGLMKRAPRDRGGMETGRERIITMFQPAISLDHSLRSRLMQEWPPPPDPPIVDSE